MAEIAPGGGSLRYATYLGGSGDDAGNAIAVDGQGDAYVTGSTNSMDFPLTPGAFQSKGDGQQQAFVAELAPGGGSLRYATFLGGSSGESGAAIALDRQGDAYITGETYSADFPVTPGAFQAKSTNNAGTSFVAELAPGGDRLRYATYLSSSSSTSMGIAVDGQGNAYVTGFTYAPDLPVTPGALQPVYGNGSAAFVARVVIAPRIPAALDPVSPPPPGATGVRYFPATHHSLAGPFLTFWQSHGGLDLLGFPLSQPFNEHGQIVQYTERARLVLAGGTVTLSPLGRLLTAGRAFVPVAPVPQSATRLYFPSTGHSLTGIFLTYWQQHQGSLLFGPPISQPLRRGQRRWQRPAVPGAVLCQCAAGVSP